MSGFSKVPIAPGAETVTIIDPAGNPVGHSGNPLPSTVGGAATYAYAAGATGAKIVKAAAGVLCRILVTVAGTAALSIYDSASAASGTVIASIPASAPVGTIYDLQMPAANGITIGGAASTPGVTVSYY